MSVLKRYNGAEWESVFGGGSDADTIGYNPSSTHPTGTVGKALYDQENRIVDQTITLLSSAWINNEQTVEISGVTINSSVIVSPAPTSIEAYSNASIYCSAVGNGEITFSCSGAPSNDVGISILVIN